MNTVFAKLGAGLRGGTQNTTRKETGHTDLIKHLRTICSYQGRNHLLLLCVDEIQKLQETATISPEHKDAISNNLYTLNDLCLAGHVNLPVTTILVGLTTAHEIIGLCISRFGNGYIVELGLFDTPYIHQILDDYAQHRHSVRPARDRHPHDLAVAPTC